MEQKEQNKATIGKITEDKVEVKIPYIVFEKNGLKPPYNKDCVYNIPKSELKEFIKDGLGEVLYDYIVEELNQSSATAFLVEGIWVKNIYGTLTQVNDDLNAALSEVYTKLLFKVANAASDAITKEVESILKTSKTKDQTK